MQVNRLLISILFQINGIRKHRIDTQILDLINLTVLNLSDNSIESIPKRLGELPLVELDLSRNALNKANYFKDWDWCDGHIIRRTLQTLILSDNKVNFFKLFIHFESKPNTQLKKTFFLFSFICS